MESKRVDMVLAGALLLEEFMTALQAKKIITTPFSLRDGILQEEIELVRQKETSHIPLHIPELYAKAVAFGGDLKRLERSVENAEILFMRLKRVHRLPQAWQAYLVAATILRDTGQAIAIRNQPAHSHYIVSNADIPSLQSWETEFVAELCLRHENGKLDLKSPTSPKDKARKTAYLKLLSLLRVVDALDSNPNAMIAIQRVAIHDRAIKLFYRGTRSANADLEHLHFERKKALFEETFKRKILLERSH